VPVVAGTGEPLCADGSLLGAGARLKRMEQREANGLLQLRITVQFDVGSAPEVVQIRALQRNQAVPAGVPCLGKSSDGEVSDGRQ
jgi:hypothetical protein